MESRSVTLKARISEYRRLLTDSSPSFPVDNGGNLVERDPSKGLPVLRLADPLQRLDRCLACAELLLLGQGPRSHGRLPPVGRVGIRVRRGDRAQS